MTTDFLFFYLIFKLLKNIKNFIDYTMLINIFGM